MVLVAGGNRQISSSSLAGHISAWRPSRLEARKMLGITRVGLYQDQAPQG